MKLKISLSLIISLFSLVSLFSQENLDTIAIQKILDASKTKLQKSIHLKNALQECNQVILKTQSQENLIGYTLRAHRIRGMIYFVIQQYDSAFLETKKGLNYFSKNQKLAYEFPEIFSSLSFNASYFEENRGNYEKAYTILINILTKLNAKDEQNISRVYNALARLYLAMEDEEKAIEYINKGYQVKGKSSLTKALLDVTKGRVYKKRNIDTALYYFTQASLYLKNNSEPIYYGTVNVAEILIKKGQLKKAKQLLTTALALQLKSDDKKLRGKTYLLLAEIAQYDKDLETEYKMLTKSESYILNNHFLPDIELLYKNFSNYYRRIGNFKKQIEYDYKTQKIRDSIQNKNKIYLAKELEIKYNTKLKEAELKRKQALIDTQKKQKNWLLIGTGSIFILSIITFTFYRKQLLTQKELAYEKLKNLRESQKINFIEARLEGENLERERIAKDLHDSISGNLAAIKMQLARIKKHEIEEVNKIIKNVDTTYHNVRALSHDLLLQKSIQNNFSESLEALVDLYRNENLNIRLNLFPKKDINQLKYQLKLEVHKIAQELITNIAKHAKASKTSISLTSFENEITFIIEDNGVGFTANTKNFGVGIQNIKSRVSSMEGQIQIDSTLQKGTTIIITFPIKHEE